MCVFVEVCVCVCVCVEVCVCGVCMYVCVVCVCVCVCWGVCVCVCVCVCVYVCVRGVQDAPWSVCAFLAKHAALKSWKRTSYRNQNKHHQNSTTRKRTETFLSASGTISSAVVAVLCTLISKLNSIKSSASSARSECCASPGAESGSETSSCIPGKFLGKQVSLDTVQLDIQLIGFVQISCIRSLPPRLNGQLCYSSQSGVFYLTSPHF